MTRGGGGGGGGLLLQNFEGSNSQQHNFGIGPFGDFNCYLVIILLEILHIIKYGIKFLNAVSKIYRQFVKRLFTQTWRYLIQVLQYLTINFGFVPFFSQPFSSFFFNFRINALEEQLESQKLTTGKQVEEESLKYKLALVGLPSISQLSNHDS